MTNCTENTVICLNSLAKFINNNLLVRCSFILDLNERSEEHLKSLSIEFLITLQWTSIPSRRGGRKSLSH